MRRGAILRWWVFKVAWQIKAKLKRTSDWESWRKRQKARSAAMTKQISKLERTRQTRIQTAATRAPPRMRRQRQTYSGRYSVNNLEKRTESQPFKSLKAIQIQRRTIERTRRKVMHNSSEASIIITIQACRINTKVSSYFSTNNARKETLRAKNKKSEYVQKEK